MNEQHPVFKGLVVGLLIAVAVFIALGILFSLGMRFH